jgi:hypothetical protein
LLGDFEQELYVFKKYFVQRGNKYDLRISFVGMAPKGVSTALDLTKIEGLLVILGFEILLLKESRL